MGRLASADMADRPSPAADITGARFFRFADPPAWAKAPLAALGVSDRDGVAVSDDTITATYGRFQLSAARSQIAGAESTGPYRSLMSVGLRLSLRDDGITFGTSGASGVCIRFDPPVPKVVGWRPTHSGLTVTVADAAGLVTALAAPGAAGHRA